MHKQQKMATPFFMSENVSEMSFCDIQANDQDIDMLDQNCDDFKKISTKKCEFSLENLNIKAKAYSEGDEICSPGVNHKQIKNQIKKDKYNS